MKIFLGYDEREKLAFEMAQRMLHRYDLEATPLEIERLGASGLLRRPVDRRGQLYDLWSNAPCATDFAVSRFLTPILAQTGWALFLDPDVAILADPREILKEADSRFAVQVVKHRKAHKAGMKMDHQEQTLYPHKNESSVALFNCDHPANRRLTLRDINERPGRDLHSWFWCAESEVGELSPGWNWLCGVTPRPEDLKIAHLTLGGPWLADWPGSEYDEIWEGACKR